MFHKLQAGIQGNIPLFTPSGLFLGLSSQLPVAIQLKNLHMCLEKRLLGPAQPAASYLKMSAKLHPEEKQNY